MSEATVTAILRFTKTTPNTVRYDEQVAGSQPISTLYIRKGHGISEDAAPLIQVSVQSYIPTEKE